MGFEDLRYEIKEDTQITSAQAEAIKKLREAAFNKMGLNISVSVDDILREHNGAKNSHHLMTDECEGTDWTNANKIGRPHDLRFK
jgi:hypothetical protein